MFSVHGTGLGGGIAIGRARRLVTQVRDVDRYHIDQSRYVEELDRLKAAIDNVRHDFESISERLPDDAPEEARALVDIHLMILADPMLVESASEMIRTDLRNAEWAVAAQAEALSAQFRQLDDAYLRERGRDVRQVSDRILKSLAGSSRAVNQHGNDPLVFVADDIAPADILELKYGMGFAIDMGGTTSHTAILARSMDVPTAVGMQNASNIIRDDDWIILDGDAGLMICAPDEAVLAEYRHRQASRELERAKLKRLAGVPSRTLDGKNIALMANIEMPEEAALALENGVDGVGLYRSEFLFMNRSDLPTEDEQYEAYREAVEAMQGRPVTIRTLDVGADKALSYGDHDAQALNPALGRRAVRYCLSRPDMFLVQLRALLRASAHGSLRILLPMITHDHEIIECLRLLDRAREQVALRRLPAAEHVPVGAMIEVPAAALSAGFFLRKLDFLSIGTNDLIQYTLAIDRSDSEVAALYDSYHPAVLRLIAMTIDAARKAGKPVSVCGELAGDPRATRLLLGMGLTEFSMHPASLLRVKREILLSEVSKLVNPVTRLVRSDDPAKIGLALARLSTPEPGV